MNQRSFIKWVGGKYKSVSQLLEIFPKKFNTYYEPFMGSGVIFFNLKPHDSILNDVEFNLVNTFRSVKREVDDVISELDLLVNEEESYYFIRREFNNEVSYIPGKKAAQFIYINKCGYNGLYRVNSLGEINVSFGKRAGDPHKDFSILKTCSKALQKSLIYNSDYREIIELSRGGDFIYFDPPYYRETSGSFISYNAKHFTDEDHQRLALECEFLSKRGVMFALSNSDTEFIRNLYKNYNIWPIYSMRSVSPTISGRGLVGEILITNYGLEVCV